MSGNRLRPLVLSVLATATTLAAGCGDDHDHDHPPVPDAAAAEGGLAPDAVPAVDTVPADASAADTATAQDTVSASNASMADAAGPLSAVADEATTTRGIAVKIDVLANDTGAARTALTVRSFQDGTNGTVRLLSDGKLAYQPKAGFDGTDTFKYTAESADGRRAEGTVTVKVLPKLGTVAGGALFAFDTFENADTYARMNVSGYRVGWRGRDKREVFVEAPDGKETVIPAPPNARQLANGPLYTGTGINAAGEVVGFFTDDMFRQNTFTFKDACSPHGPRTWSASARRRSTTAARSWARTISMSPSGGSRTRTRRP